MVPLAGIEPALLAESDFESDASTSSAIGARQQAGERVGCTGAASRRQYAMSGISGSARDIGAGIDAGEAKAIATCLAIQNSGGFKRPLPPDGRNGLDEPAEKPAAALSA